MDKPTNQATLKADISTLSQKVKENSISSDDKNVLSVLSRTITSIQSSAVSSLAADDAKTLAETCITLSTYTGKDIKIKALGAISAMAEKKLIENNQISVFVQLVSAKKDEFTEESIHRATLTAISSIMKAYTILPADADCVLDVAMLFVNDSQDVNRSAVFFIIAQIAKSNAIPSARVSSILSTALNAVNDTCDEVRSNVFVMVAHLAERNLIAASEVGYALDKMMPHVNDKHDNARCNVLLAIVNLSDHHRIPAADVDGVLRIILPLVNDKFDKVTNNALSAIATIAKSTSISSSLVEDIIDMVLPHTSSSQHNIRSHAMLALANVAELNPIPHAADTLTKILSHIKDSQDTVRCNTFLLIANIMEATPDIPSETTTAVSKSLLSGIGDKDDKARSVALFSMAKLIKNYGLALNLFEECKRSLIKCLQDSFPDARTNAWYAIAQLTKPNPDYEDSDYLIESMYKELLPLIDKLFALPNTDADQSIAVARAQAMFVIANFCLKASQQVKVSDKIIESLLGHIMPQIDDPHDLTRCYALLALQNLASDYMLPSTYLHGIIDPVLRHVNDKDSASRSNAIAALGHMLNFDLIPVKRIDEVMEAIVAHITDSYDIARRYALFAISNIVKHNHVHPSKQTQLLNRLLPHVDDSFSNARSNALVAIARMMMNNPIADINIDDVITRVIPHISDADFYCRIGAIWVMAVMALINVIPRNRKEFISEILLPHIHGEEEFVRITAIFAVTFLHHHSNHLFTLIPDIVPTLTKFLKLNESMNRALACLAFSYICTQCDEMGIPCNDELVSQFVEEMLRRVKNPREHRVAIEGLANMVVMNRYGKIELEDQVLALVLSAYEANPTCAYLAKAHHAIQHRDGKALPDAGNDNVLDEYSFEMKKLQEDTSDLLEDLSQMNDIKANLRLEQQQIKEQLADSKLSSQQRVQLEDKLTMLNEQIIDMDINMKTAQAKMEIMANNTEELEQDYVEAKSRANQADELNQRIESLVQDISKMKDSPSFWLTSDSLDRQQCEQLINLPDFSLQDFVNEDVKSSYEQVQQQIDVAQAEGNNTRPVVGARTKQKFDAALRDPNSIAGRSTQFEPKLREYAEQQFLATFPTLHHVAKEIEEHYRLHFLIAMIFQCHSNPKIRKEKLATIIGYLAVFTKKISYNAIIHNLKAVSTRDTKTGWNYERLTNLNPSGSLATVAMLAEQIGRKIVLTDQEKIYMSSEIGNSHHHARTPHSPDNIHAADASQMIYQNRNQEKYCHSLIRRSVECVLDGTASFDHCPLTGRFLDDIPIYKQIAVEIVTKTTGCSKVYTHPTFDRTPSRDGGSEGVSRRESFDSAYSSPR